MTGKFIVFDGNDGRVLERQSAQLVAWLRRQGVPVTATHEPSDGPVGGQVRQVLSGRLAVASLTSPLLFLADRLDHLHKNGDGILAQLAQGKWVVCTRYLLSALAYQTGHASLDWLAQINRPCPWPDVMVWCDSPGEPEQRARFESAVAHHRSEGRDVLAGNAWAAEWEEICRGLLAASGAKENE
jgi:dTMP kinase